MDNYKNLPTQWIITDTKGKILALDISLNSVARVAKDTIAASKNYVHDKTARYILAKCHYTIGPDGEKQYYTSLEQIPEALKCFPIKELPAHSRIRQIYHYGAPQLAVQ